MELKRYTHQVIQNKQLDQSYVFVPYPLQWSLAWDEHQIERRSCHTLLAKLNSRVTLKVIEITLISILHAIVILFFFRS